jgi:hypothetical protein
VRACTYICGGLLQLWGFYILFFEHVTSVLPHASLELAYKTPPLLINI